MATVLTAVGFTTRLPAIIRRPFLIERSRFLRRVSGRAMSAALQQPSVPAATSYGSWRSPITADVVSGADKRLGGIAIASDGRLLYVESRPDEKGRAVLVKEEASGEVSDVTPKDFAVRTVAQEYGGGAFAVDEDVVVFSNYKDQRLYKQKIGDSVPEPLTPEYGDSLVRYADGVFDHHFNRYVTVMEDHRESISNPTTTISTISIVGVNEPKVLISGNDFYAFPRIDPNQRRMAWIEWSHPNMPWDKSELWVGYFSETGDLTKKVCIAGCDPTIIESPSEPKWSPKGELYFITDRVNGFWNIYTWNEENNAVASVYSLAAEFTRPLWVFGISSYDFLEKDDKNYNIICSYRKDGKSYVGVLECDSGSFTIIDTPFSDVSNVVSKGNYFYIEGASHDCPLSVAKVSLDQNLSQAAIFSIIWSSSQDVSKYKPYFSAPEIIEFPTEVPGQTAYAYFYKPINPFFKSLPDEKPPLLVKTHGGPTGESRGILDLSVQYWTSRGWAFVDVNYGGSTGYGREYRERLLGQWGVVDVNDCCSCAKHLVESGKVDGQRLCIMGRSAGGYTTLASLAFRNLFSAGASLYGVADLSALRADTHKFESHYLDKLIGDEKAYYERSPINFIDSFTCPVIFFQGLEDKVVPPEQAQKMHSALKAKGLPVALVEYEGEQHGFRKAENIKFTIEQQMVFFARLVGHFSVADDISPIKIDNYD